MCGIVGAIGTINPELLQAVAVANGTQRHRGPDDEGSFQSGVAGEPGAAFGFRRLAIIDLSTDGHQPMTDASTGNVIVFNGEIYNYRELRAELEALGQVFQSKSDTEVILKAYAVWGKDALRRLHGMFGFAIWDAKRRSVLLARDRLGIKPIYVATVRGADGRPALLFASELRSLLATGLIARRLDSASVASYVWHGFVVGPGTIIDGIELLPAGAVVTIDPASVSYRPERYWRLPAARPRADGVDQLRHELELAVRQHLISDVPLGVFLSGGIDSSAIAAFAVKAAEGRVRTFNISFDEAEYDESKYARAVADGLGTEHTDVRLSEHTFHAQLEDALRSVDQPTFDGINTYFVSRAVREAGITVALAGTGGDELFGGYQSFVDIPRARAVSRALRPVPELVIRELARAAARVKMGRPGAVPPQTRWGKLGDALASRGDVLGLYQTQCALFSDDFSHQLLARRSGQPLWRGLDEDRAAELEQLIAGQPTLHAVATLELASFVGERLLRDTDGTSMAVSLEARVPLLDDRVVDAVAAVPEERRFFPLRRKALLRELALSALDPAIFDRPKSGFVLPIDVWARKRLRPEVSATLRSSERCESVGLSADAVSRLWSAFESGAPGLYWSRIWSIFALLWWCREQRASL